MRDFSLARLVVRRCGGWTRGDANLDFQAAPRLARGRPTSTSPPSAVGTRGGGEGRQGSQTDMPPGMPGGAMCVQRFDDSRVLQFTLRIAFRCVLHRCESLEIRCVKLFLIASHLVSGK
jgi:hypothetical protein